MWTYTGEGDPAQSPIDGMWAEFIGDGYESVRAVVPYQPGSVPPIACRDQWSVEQWRGAAAYCRLDQTIAYDAEFLRAIFDEVGPDAAVAFLAHEWGHHVQHVTARGEFDIQDELQADCYAGLFASSRELATGVEIGSLSPIAEAFYNLGNERFSTSRWFLTREHGSPFQRFNAWSLGYTLLELGHELCSGYESWRPGQTAKIGTFRYLELPGRHGTLDGDQHYRLEDPDLPLLEIDYIELDDADGATPSEHAASLLADRFGPRLGRLIGPGQYATDVQTAWYHYSADVDGESYTEHGVLGVMLSPADPDHAVVIHVVGVGSVPVADDAPQAELQQARVATQVALLAFGRTCAPHQHATDADPSRYSPACQPDL